MKTIKVLIKGKVQGVFYRATAKDVAEEVGLKGWIRNLSEGSVEALITGTEEQIKRFIEWCSKGPSRAKVSDVILTDQEFKTFDNFSILR